MLFNNANTIEVYCDKRIISTFKKTFNKLKEGKSIVIFPEGKKDYNNIINDFQTGYVDIARMYYKRTGKALKFVPLYIAPNLRKMYMGKSVEFSPDEPIENERERITAHLMKEITDIARNLPEHKVVPYKNVPKKEHKTNYEKTGC